MSSEDIHLLNETVFSVSMFVLDNCLLMEMQLYKMKCSSHYLTLLALKVSEMWFIQSVVKENNQGCISSIFYETNLKSKVVPEILAVLLFLTTTLVGTSSSSVDIFNK